MFEQRQCYVYQKYRLRHIWWPKLEGLSETRQSLIWILFLASSGHTNRLQELHKRGIVGLVEMISRVCRLCQLCLSSAQIWDGGRQVASYCFSLQAEKSLCLEGFSWAAAENPNSSRKPQWFAVLGALMCFVVSSLASALQAPLKRGLCFWRIGGFGHISYPNWRYPAWQVQGTRRIKNRAFPG